MQDLEFQNHARNHTLRVLHRSVQFRQLIKRGALFLEHSNHLSIHGYQKIKISSLLACEVVGVKCLFVIPFYGAQRQVSYAYVVAAFIGIFDNGIKTCQEHLFKFQLFQIGPTLERVFHTADKKVKFVTRSW